MLARGVVVMETRQEAVTRQQCLCPEPTHAVLTAGEQNITHGTSVRREEMKEKEKKEGQWLRQLVSNDVSHLMVLVLFNSRSKEKTCKR